jgi:hypothetical protein
MFSNESRFLLERHDGRIRVYRRPHERYAHNYIREALNFSGGSIMVWGGITENFRTQLVPIRERITAQCYINNGSVTFHFDPNTTVSIVSLVFAI